LGLALAQPSYAASGQSSPEIDALLAYSPALLEMQPDGSNPVLTFPKTVAADDLPLLRLAYGWTFVVRDAKKYSIQETEQTSGGTQQCSYTWQPGLVLRKQRTSQSMPGMAGVNVEVIRSEFSGRPGHLWLAEMHGSETIRITVEARLVGEVTMNMHLKEIPTESPPQILARLAETDSAGQSAYFAAGTPAKSITAALKQAQKAARWTGVTMDAVLAPLKAAAGKPIEETAALMSDMAEWLAAHPESLSAFVSQIQTATDPELSNLLLHALQSSDPILANSGLDTILAAPGNEAILMQALVESGSLRANASPALVERLQNWYATGVTNDRHDIGDTAGFNLARIAKSQPSVMQWLHDQYMADLSPTAPPDDQIAALRMFENAASNEPTVVSRVQELAKSGAPDVQATALSYVGILPPTPEHDQTLLTALRGDNKLLRSAAATTLSNPARQQTAEIQQALQDYETKQQQAQNDAPPAVQSEEADHPAEGTSPEEL
jgi:hypothetical protein